MTSLFGKVRRQHLPWQLLADLVFCTERWFRLVSGGAKVSIACAVGEGGSCTAAEREGNPQSWLAATQ